MTSLEIRCSGAFALRIKGFQKLSLKNNEQERFFSEILRELAMSKNERALLQAMVYDCIISGDIHAPQPKLTKVEE